MKMERLNAWLGLAGNIAVLLGLVALAVEINGNTKALRVQVMENSAAMNQELRLAIAGNADLQAIIAKSLLSPADLTPSELWGAITHLERAVLEHQRGHRLYKSGVISEAEWQADLQTAPYQYGTVFGRLVWNELKTGLDPDFVAEIDNELATFEGETNEQWLRKIQEKVANLDS